MTKKPIVTDSAPTPAGAYSPGIQYGDLVFTAGFGPQDPLTGQIAGDDIETQTRQVLANVAAVLETAGLGLADVLKATVHLANLERDFAGFNAVYSQCMPKPYPVRTTVGSQLMGILVEIDVIAGKPA